MIHRLLTETPNRLKIGTLRRFVEENRFQNSPNIFRHVRFQGVKKERKFSEIPHAFWVILDIGLKRGKKNGTCPISDRKAHKEKIVIHGGDRTGGRTTSGVSEHVMGEKKRRDSNSSMTRSSIL